MITNVKPIRPLKGRPIRKPTPFPVRPAVGAAPDPAIQPLAKQYSARAQRASKRTSF